MNARAKQRIETRQKIYDCAIDLFMHKPYDTVKITDITDAASVSVGAFYHHFSTKNDLIDEGYRYFDEALLNAYLEDQPADGIEGIKYLIKKQLQDVDDKGVYLTDVFFKNQIGVKHPFNLNPERFFYKKLRENIAIIKNDSDMVIEIADRILRMSRGTIYDWCMHNGSYDVVDVGMKDLDVLIKYFKLD